MSDDLNNFLSDIDAHQASTAKMRERDPGGKWGLAVAWGAPKDGKPTRPFMSWRPSAAEWERRSIEFHERQAEEADKFAKETDDRIRRQKLSTESKEVSSVRESVSKNAPRNRHAGKSSSTHNGNFDLKVVTI